MTEDDRAKRVKFAKNMQKNYRPDVWTQEIAFYLDGMAFTQINITFFVTCFNRSSHIDPLFETKTTSVTFVGMLSPFFPFSPHQC